ncbi:hypothetical protein P8452_17021 [Trifolium repens]|nr:hypothetical protein P8452_17021 [Trifolium repens]
MVSSHFRVLHSPSNPAPPLSALHNLSSHCNLIPFLPVIFVFTTPLLPSPTLNNKHSRINCAAMDNGGDANNVEMNGGNDMHNEEGEEEWDGYTTIDQFTVFCCVNLQE